MNFICSPDLCSTLRKGTSSCREATELTDITGEIEIDMYAKTLLSQLK